ncbi:MAG: DUF6134 family protein [Rhodothalassiaceae bacterium]
MALLAKACVVLTGFTIVAVQVAPATATNTVPDSFAFDVEARGIDGGKFHVSHSVEDGKRIVDVDANLKFKLGFITLKKVKHHSREVWSDNTLQALDSETKKDGDLILVKAEATPKCLLVQSSEKGELEMPLDTTPTSFTKPGLFNGTETRNIDLLDTLNGRERPSVLSFGGRERIKIRDALVDSRYYQVHSRETGELTHEFWIDDAGMAMQIFQHTDDGTKVEYTYSG